MDTLLLLNARTVRQQPTGIQNKNLVCKMLTSCSLSGPGEQKGMQATNRHPKNKKVVCKMLTSCSLLSSISYTPWVGGDLKVAPICATSMHPFYHLISLYLVFPAFSQ